MVVSYLLLIQRLPEGLYSVKQNFWVSADKFWDAIFFLTINQNTQNIFYVLLNYVSKTEILHLFCISKNLYLVVMLQ